MDSYYREKVSFDAKLLDLSGREVLVDCNLRLPAIWGEKVEINIGIPHSEMPINVFENPCQLSSLQDAPNYRVEMGEVCYRKITTGLHQARKFGLSPIILTHVAHLKIVDQCPNGESKFYICITPNDYLSDNTSLDSSQMLEELTSFHCSTLGEIKLQRYWVKSRVSSSNDYALKSGYWLEVSADMHKYEANQILQMISPILDILSIIFRQRVSVVGWQSLQSGVRTRYWIYPIEPSETHYAGLEPKKYVASINDLSEVVNKAIHTHKLLQGRGRQWLFFLSYGLSPAIQLQDAERFMSLFRTLEKISSESYEPKAPTDANKVAAEMLQDLADSMEEMGLDTSSRMKGFAKMLTNGDSPLADKIINFLNAHSVSFKDLWDIEGKKKGLIGIRNKLAHGGAHYINHQSLAVATFHLSVLAERVACTLLEIPWKESHRREMRDEWLDPSYVQVLQNEVLKVKNVYEEKHGTAK
ncbi:hypothetical protein MAQ5080_01353 [Marinomonas aquimarina]|uniref:ApeA N-terminal domain-containing protein n=1 Tax=Marinomonas aquimarina TaxID=295068 RepID=A0A1A8TBV4_9GAMM|nr:hypothetical protein [Marinomonas aquimarina]SBS29302.1 hypothetical protein MAQ5080_01353 [Marinomonas aquimarina]